MWINSFMFLFSPQWTKKAFLSWKIIAGKTHYETLLTNPTVIAAYWLLISAVKCWFWRHPKVVTIFQEWRCQKSSLRRVYGCLSWGNHLNDESILKKPKPNVETLKLSIFCQNRQEREEAADFCRHTLPQAEPFIYQTLPHRGVCCYFRPPITLLFVFFLPFLNFPEVGVCCWAAEAKTHTATHTQTATGWRGFVCCLGSRCWRQRWQTGRWRGDSGDQQDLHQLNHSTCENLHTHIQLTDRIYSLRPLHAPHS